uniref:Leucine-rich repeat domain-containing protein n=1 Tax=Pseudothermotoga hypogea TaxID=57487 RepID=A0A832MNI6_9THEM
MRTTRYNENTTTRNNRGERGMRRFVLALFLMAQVVLLAGQSITRADVIIVHPANNSVVVGTIFVQIAVDQNVDAVKVEIYVDEIKVEEDSSAPYEYSWNTDTLEHSSVHSIQAKVYDKAGNVRISPTVSVSVGDPNEPVTFVDLNLEKAVRNALKISSDQPITRADMARLTSLSVRNKSIQDLSGLECAINLKELRLNNNQISDLCPLSTLTNLKWLYMDNNQISDILPLANLFNLHTLSLSNNHVSDIQSLANLVNMEWLDLSNNQIGDISPLANLTNLKWLILNNNQISDIGALVGNAGLGKGELVELRNNLLDLSPGSDDMQNIETLRSRGVIVRY